MYCSKCGNQNSEDAKFCANCGNVLSSESKSEEVKSNYQINSLSFLMEKKVNVNFALIALIFGPLSFLFFWVPVLSSVLGVISITFQAIVMYQWADTLNSNTKNTQMVLNQLLSHQQSGEKSDYVRGMLSRLDTYYIDLNLYWVYLGMALLGNFANFFGIGWVFSLISFILLWIYLQRTFNVQQQMQNDKNRFYSYFLGFKASNLDQMKWRNFGLVFVFIIFSFGIYWLYLLMAMSTEINNYIDADKGNRNYL